MPQAANHTKLFICPCGAWKEKIEKNRQKYIKIFFPCFYLFLFIFLFNAAKRQIIPSYFFMITYYYYASRDESFFFVRRRRINSLYIINNVYFPPFFLSLSCEKV